MEVRTIVKLFSVFCAFVLLIVIWPFASVPASSRGIVTTFGKPSVESSMPGIHIVWPIAQTMNLVNVSVRKSEDQGEAASKDLQTVHTTITLNYHVAPESVLPVFVNLGNDPEVRIVQPSVQEAVKAVTAKFTAEELIGRREEVRNMIIADLASRMERHGLIIDEFSITNFNFSKVFNEAIEAKTTAEQTKLKADTDLKRIRVEAMQTVVQAQAQADALKAQKQEITPDLIRLREVENQTAAIEKWDGALPTYVTSGTAMPFINMAK